MIFFIFYCVVKLALKSINIVTTAQLKTDLNFLYLNLQITRP